MNHESNRNHRASRRRRERGFSLIEIMVALSLLTIALAMASVVAIRGLLQAYHARLQYDARTAASVLVNAPAPAGPGGSVAPSAPVDGWSDDVVVNRSTGAFEPLEGQPPEGSLPIRRQWRVAAENGVEVYTVSAELLTADAAAPLPAPEGGARFVFNRLAR